MSEPLTPAQDASSPPAAKTVLVTRDSPLGDTQLTGNQETDAPTAVMRGLAEYLSGLSIEAVGGRRVRLKRVFEEWAEPEKITEFPSARVQMMGPGTYEARSLTPSLDPAERLKPPDGRYLILPCDFVADVGVEVWCNDPEQRIALSMAMEIALLPRADKYGFDLQLPHYFGARATYELKEHSATDDYDNALRRYRVFNKTLSVRVPVISLFSFPDARPRFLLEAVSEDLDVVVTTEVS